MIIYEPIGFFKVTGEELEKLCREVLELWPSHIVFEEKQFGSLEEYKCTSFTTAYEMTAARLDATNFPYQADLAPIVFDFVSRAIKHSSVYLSYVETAQFDVRPIVKDMAAREDIIVSDSSP